MAKHKIDKTKAKNPRSATAKTPVVLPKKRSNPMSRRLQILLGGALVVVGLAVVGSILISRVAAERYKIATFTHVQPVYDIAGALASRPTATLVGSEGMLKKLHASLGSKRQTFTLNTCPASNDAVIQKLPKH